MNYVFIKQSQDRDINSKSKIHVLASDGTLSCGVSIKNEFDNIVNFEEDRLCKKCLERIGLKPIERKFSLYTYITKTIKPVIDQCDPIEVLSTLSYICDDISKYLIEFNACCYPLIDYKHDREIRGKIVMEGKQYIYILFSYKPQRKERLRFEKRVRDNLTVLFEQALR